MRTEQAFEVLEIEQTASGEDIKEAYKDKVRALHPDRLGAGADEAEWKAINDRFSKVQEAYRTLTEGNALGNQAYRIRKQRYQQERKLKQTPLQRESITDLPEDLIAELNQRTDSDRRDQLFIPREEWSSYITVLLVCLVFLIAVMTVTGWPTSVVDWSIWGVASLASVGALGFVGYKWKRHSKAALIPGVWILPTDVIIVDHEKVSISPLLSVHRWAVSPNGSPMNRSDQVHLRFRLYNSTLRVSVDSMNRANQIEFAMRYWQKLWKSSDDLMAYYRENSLVYDLNNAPADSSVD
jgi:hypothetical protein